MGKSFFLLSSIAYWIDFDLPSIKVLKPVTLVEGLVEGEIEGLEK